MARVLRRCTICAKLRTKLCAKHLGTRIELLACGNDGFDDIGVAGAAANLPAQFVADGLRIGMRVPPV